ncbi:hypothetical protein O5264_28695, partial [Escherichia coli]|nr:hypothetical protein [Escherichia coli]
FSIPFLMSKCVMVQVIPFFNAEIKFCAVTRRQHKSSLNKDSGWGQDIGLAKHKWAHRRNRPAPDDYQSHKWQVQIHGTKMMRL